MALLIFLGISLLGLFGGFSTGPNVYSEVGVPTWAVLHKGSEGISVEDFDLPHFMLALGWVVCLTWVLEKVFHARAQRA
jgi:hypothetical protein